MSHKSSRLLSNFTAKHSNDREKLMHTNLLPVSDSTGTFLPVTASKLVSNLRSFSCSHAYFTELVALLVNCDHYLIHNTGLSSTHEHTSISFREPLSCSFQLKYRTIPMQNLMRLLMSCRQPLS